MRGQFRLYPGEKREIVIPNTVVDTGERDFLKMMMQDNQAVVAGGANFYLGLCAETPGETDTLVDITTEPSGAGGYAREGVARSGVGFPTIDQVNGVYRAVSQVVVFAASGADFDTAIDRCFLCSVASGTAGTLFAYSGALASLTTVLDGETLSMQYELFLD